MMRKKGGTCLKLPSKRTAMILCICMIIGSCMSGTLAYLTSEAGDINTFVIGKIKIELSETDTEVDGDEDANTNTYKIEEIGQSITKDPTITVKAGSAPCWLFVEVVESENFEEYLEYQVVDGWNSLEGHENIYYCKIDERTLADTEYSVIKDDLVNVKDTVTARDLNQLTEENYPTLTVKAYAVQLGAEGSVLGSAADAWKQMELQNK